MRAPRLIQPLFSSEEQKAAKASGTMYAIVRAYDVLWNLVYEPEDVVTADRWMNAGVVMQNLGMLLEVSLGENIFEQTKPGDEPNTGDT